ncbi:lon protease homolog 2, peroxisomal-like isoform X4 [Zingiber officinale]|uniref:lon protease homolog 2, peroxisomal-like isoform X4 n=1 Tax=Zingiber officinale TaxID=94328 RepID=UPI001C4B78F7|nr:lon protease homolog 2, peroxisomal-like isoform X4 [Zingiber officinale]
MEETVELPSRLAILPFWNKVLLPGAVIRICCTSPSSVKLVEHELWQKEKKGLIGVLPVKDSEGAAVGSLLSSGIGSDSWEQGRKGEPNATGGFHKQDAKKPRELTHWHSRGVAARALHLSREVEKPSGRVTYVVVLEGLSRFNVQELSARGKYYVANINGLDLSSAELEQAEQDPDFISLSRQFKATAMELISLLEQSIRVAEKITQKVEGQLSKSQREFLLKQQMRAIKEELGDNDDCEDDVAAVERKMQNAGMPPNIWKLAQRELRRLKKMQPQQPGYNSSCVYLELLADLPWRKVSEEPELDLKAAKVSLDRDHYGLLKVKQRIIEYLAVRKLKPDAQGPVLCFVGPPGVGKTSLASSIASALSKKFIRISLGGVKDEADIRGHRRTYIGSMPGRLIDGLKRVAVRNPVMLLDEIDKTGSDVRGDPASALLEVLDPEQNKTFNDHYLNVPFDLSKVTFVATANRVQPIPPPLLDRMEVIELLGYTPEEKLKIALKHLIPRVLEQHGLSSQFLQIPEGIVKLIIQRYTREAGVRNLERNLAALARAAAVKVAEKDFMVHLGKDNHPKTSLMNTRLVDTAEVEMEVIPLSVDSQGISNSFSSASVMIIDEAMLEKVLGPPRFDEKETADRVATPGIVVGLVWTTFGGDIQFIEATTMVGKGDLHLTGQLGDVIKESAHIALTWVRARAADLNLSTAGDHIGLLEKQDIHIHFPAGAVPKDGPSAGITLVTALVSLFSQRKVRADTAMTGEMTLKGLVLPVGGIKDKVLAANRYGIKRVILPERNSKDLAEVPSAILAGMERKHSAQKNPILHGDQNKNKHLLCLEHPLMVST